MTKHAVLGMIVGIVFAATCILGSAYGGWSSCAFGIGPQGIGVVGMLLNFAVIFGLTPFFLAPNQSVQDLIMSNREPEDAPPALDIDQRVEAD